MRVFSFQPQHRIFFVGDSHLESHPDPDRLKSFLELLDQVQPGDTLVLLGDIFDFWFEYPGMVQAGHLPVLSRLSELAQGSQVLFIPGNHDIWAGRLLESFGPRVCRAGVELTLSGEPVWATHGDMLGRRNWLGRAILGNGCLTWLYARLHPEIGIPIASWVSARSRKRSQKLPLPTEAPDWMFATVPDGIRCVVLGHFHIPFMSESDGVALVCVGDWITNFTYGLCQDGVMSVIRQGTGAIGEIVL